MREPKKVSYLKAIRAKCMDCTCGQAKEIKTCPIVSCPLFPYRFGVNPTTYIKNNKENIKIL